LAFIAMGVAGAFGASAAQGQQPAITTAIDESRIVTLGGNTRPEAIPANDRGALRDDYFLDHMLLQLRRSPEVEQALESYINELHDPNSANYQKWLTADELGQKYGVAVQDIDKITQWLAAHGFRSSVYPNQMLIDFSGTAGDVRQAFHTEIHALSVEGENHISNMSDPQIPAALARVVAGVVSLNDFRPQAMNEPRPEYTYSKDGYLYADVVPGDLATIYNLNPAFKAGYTGKGQTVVVIEPTNVYSTEDWTTFRKYFGLSTYTSGSFVTVHPAPKSGTDNCANPGYVGGDGAEAILDAEWASAAAPNAEIEMASCASTSTTFGGLIAMENLLNESSTPPAIMSVSYGICEAFSGATQNEAFEKAYEQAVSEGVSVYVAAGDQLAAVCDRGAAGAIHGVAVSGWASTPYNVAVGGTDFSDTYSVDQGTYWNTSDTTYYESAKSYIPEIPWNGSCANILLAYYYGYETTYGADGFCNSSTGEDYFWTVSGGSGGPSGCATGTPSVKGVVSGTCKGWPKPSWQTGLVGIHADGVRDLPDVSLFASEGVWGHAYIICYSDTKNGGVPCTGAPSNWWAGGGTSFASPIWAGFQALVNQKLGKRQGNPNTVLYKLAAKEYGTKGDTSCYSNAGNKVGSTCTFYDVTAGDISVNCDGTHDCFTDGVTIGVLSTSDSAYDVAFPAGIGYDFASGLGTVNVYNLLNNWNTVAAAPASPR